MRPIMGTLSVALLLASAVLPVRATTASGTGGALPIHYAMVMGHGTHPTLATGNLSYHGGQVEKRAKVYIIYWGWTSDPSGEAPYLEQFFAGLGGTGWNNILTQYYETKRGHISNPKRVLGGTWHDTTNPIPANPSIKDMGLEAQRAAVHFGYHMDGDYFIATPTGHSTPGFQSSFCAFHSIAAIKNHFFAYTDFPYMTDAGKRCGQNAVNQGAAGLLDGVSMLAGHEYAEVATDPLISGWWYTPTSLAGEIGDECEWKNVGNVRLGNGTYAMQPLWSNKVSGCAMSL